MLRNIQSTICIVILLCSGALMWGAPEITQVNIINADTDAVIRTLQDEDVVNLAVTGENLNMQAVVNGETASVLFSLDDDPYYRTESFAPYALAGDDGAGDFYAWTPPRGPHYLTVIPFDTTGATGTSGEPVSFYFNVVDDEPDAPSGLLCELFAYPERVEINDTTPEFSWIVNSDLENDYQTACRILVASSEAQLDSNIGDMWDSGKTATTQSVSMEYGGSALSASTTYYWKVMTWDKTDSASAWSSTQEFNTSAGLGTYDYGDSYPLNLSRAYLELTHRYPVRVVEIGSGHYFIDFGKDAVGWAQLRLDSSVSETITFHLGEAADGDSVDSSPGGTIRYSVDTKSISAGLATYELRATGPNPDLYGNAVDTPAEYGRITPFRYVEIENCSTEVTTASISQVILCYPFDFQAASFVSSDDILNQVWELCRYSMFATNFLGVFIDGDRERTPYEADAYINQLTYYAADREFTISRYTNEYLFDHSTWPFEWKQHTIMQSHADYLYTGDTDSIVEYYSALESSKLQTSYARSSDGLLDTSGTTDEIVDWPSGERDGYDFRAINTVVNAFYYKNLCQMAEMADAIGNTTEAEDFRTSATAIKTAFNNALLNTGSGYYVDGEGSSHSSLHANMFPLAFGLVPDAYKDSVIAFIESRGMACSVYGAQYLLDSLYLAGEDDYALSLMNSTSMRSWYNMIASGSTITMEAWDIAYKSNLDWNHAWGAAAGNAISRHLLGLQPISAGFEHARIYPQLGSLSFAEGTIPTIRGSVDISVHQTDYSWRLNTTTPANMYADIVMPKLGATPVVVMDGALTSATEENDTLIIETVGSGDHEFIVLESVRGLDPWIVASVDPFTTQSIGALTTDTVTVTLYNAGISTLTLTQLTLDKGTYTTDGLALDLTGLTLPGENVPPGESIQFTVDWRPAAYPGSRDFQILVDSNDPDDDPIALSGAVLAPMSAEPRVPYTVDSYTLHLYHLDESSGTTSADAVTPGLDVTSVTGGAALGATSYSGFDLALDTSSTASDDARAEIGGGDAVATTSFWDQTTGAFTYEALIYMNFDPNPGNESGRTVAMQIFSMDDDSGDRPFQWRLVPPGHAENSSATTYAMQFINIDGGQTISTVLPTTGDHAAGQDVWYHVAMTYTGVSEADNFKYYWTRMDSNAVEANELYSTMMTSDLSSTNGDPCIGNELRSTATDNFDGLIDEVRISDIARGADDMLFSGVTASYVQNVVVIDADTVKVVFSKAMGTDALLAASYTLSGSGQGTLNSQPDTVDYITTGTYQINWSSGEMTIGGDIVINVATIEDADGADLAEPSSGADDGAGIGGEPTATMTLPTSGTAYTAGADVTLAWSATDDVAGVDYVRIYYQRDGGAATELDGSPFDAGISTTTTQFLLPGSYELYAVATDLAGNEEVTDPDADRILIQINPGPPLVQQVEVIDADTIEVVFSNAMGPDALDPASYTLSGSGQGTFDAQPASVTGVSTNTYRLNWTAQEMTIGGDITITVATIQDTLGADLVEPKSGTDAGAGIGGEPTATMNQPASGSIFETNQDVTLGWSATDDVAGIDIVSIYYQRNGGAITELSGSPFDVLQTSVVTQFSLSGIYEIYAVATDLAGNEETADPDLDIITIEIETPEPPPPGRRNAASDRWLLY
ncbi:family 78 glycoside hydrolase catalytic domain [Candidatus Sumerlaeota bacterium]|nr:family 78 glycoside hydrolase catalytic domain [Candidatus Sumerlaeota bacterium]